MTFSEKLVKLRKIKGITQDEFASAVGVSRQAVYKWESGQSYPEVSKLLEIKMLFGLSIDDLLDESYEVIVPEKKRRKRLPKAVTEVIEETVRAEEKVAVPAAEEKKPEPKPEPVYEAPVYEEPAREVIEEVIEEPVYEAPAEEPVAEPVYAAAEAAPVEVEATPVEAEPAEEKAEPRFNDSDLFAPESEQIEEKREEKRGFFGRLFGRK